MEANFSSRFSPASSDVTVDEEFMEVKKGPWTLEEDALLMNYVSLHGEGRWNSVALFAATNTTVVYADEPKVHDQVTHETAHSGSTSPFSYDYEGSYSDNNTQSSITDSSFVEGGDWSWPQSNCSWLGGDQEDLIMMDNLQWYQENIEFLQQQLFDD
ncbi:hypothetical protein SAY86_016098 [Trapa natans]|uniref:Uncharacterized protein n=1 Tax=Trapa natans TaxID=22666 RepID=A0AAN7QZ49_TRANT|nr:hypothetical protein SAY86_016098 [Trapa natans]